MAEPLLFNALEILPDDVVALILTYLPFSQLARIGLSSKWAEHRVWFINPKVDLVGCNIHVSRIEQLRTAFFADESDSAEPPLANLRTLVLTPENLRHKADDVLREIPHRFSSTLRDLSLPGLRAAVSDGSFRNFHFLTGLTRLDLTGVEAITSEGLGHLARMYSLRELVLVHCNKIRWLTSLAPLAAEGKYLRRLEINLPKLRWDDMKDQQKAITIGSFTRLRELIITGSSSLTDPSFLPISKLTNLKLLNMKDLEKVTPEALSAVVTHLPRLRLFNCRGTALISDSSMRDLIQFCTKLQSASIFNVRRLTDGAFEHSAALQRLQKLVVSSCMSLSDQLLEAISRNTKLIHLNVTRTAITDAGLVHLECLTNLRQLIVMQCTGITDTGLASLRSLNLLEHLTLSGCAAITDAALTNHVSALSCLQSLYITRCQKVSDTGIRALSHLANLTELAAGYCPLLSDDGISSLRHLTRLTMFYLPGCPSISAQMRASVKASVSDEPLGSPERPVRVQPQQRRSLNFPLGR